MKILSICTSAGLWDRAWIEAGHEVIAGCEIKEHKRRMYKKWCGGTYLCHDINDLPDIIRYQHFDMITGCPPCQSKTILKSIRNPKFPDLTDQVNAVLQAATWNAFLFENVSPINIPSAKKAKLNAMNFPVYWKNRPYHQSRLRWFTFSPNLIAPSEVTAGDVNELMAYSVVAGRIYGPKRGAVLQGWPEFANLDEPCTLLQEALADGVPRGLADAWIQSIEALQLNDRQLRDLRKS